MYLNEIYIYIFNISAVHVPQAEPVFMHNAEGIKYGEQAIYVFYLHILSISLFPFHRGCTASEFKSNW